MVKIAIKSENITPYGGIFHVMDAFSKLGLGKLIESTLGQRGNTGKAFQYRDILSSIFYSYLCGADCLEDINKLAPQFSMTPCMTRWGLKKLRTDDEIYTSKISGKEYKFNTAERLNQLLLTMTGSHPKKRLLPFTISVVKARRTSMCKTMILPLL